METRGMALLLEPASAALDNAGDTTDRRRTRPTRLRRLVSAVRRTLSAYGVSRPMQPKTRDNCMSAEEIASFLAERSCGVISLNGEDGFPYGVPVNYVVMDGSIYFHGSRRWDKVDAIARDPRCCFTVVEEGGFEITGESACNTTTVFRSVIVRGKAVAIADEGAKAEVLRRIVDVFVPERKGVPMNMASVPPTAVYRIDAVASTGKRHRPMAGNRIVGSLR